MMFYVGLDDVYNACHFDRCFISVNRLKQRKGDFVVHDWIMDSGAFSQIKDHGCFMISPEAYVDQINRWARCGNLLAAAVQDWMCEPFILQKTGLTVLEHQRRTLESYRFLQDKASVYVMPVLQGFAPSEYVAHLHAYGDLLKEGMWVGVGSVCKRNAKPSEVERVLTAISQTRPDLRLHGFGLKITALQSAIVRGLLWSADSMAWSYHERKQKRNAHDYRAAQRFVNRVESQTVKARQQWLLWN